MYGHRNGSEEVQGFFGVLGGYRNPPGKLLSLLSHRGGEGRQATGGGARPPSQSELDKGWGRGPPFLLPLPLFPFPPSIGRDEGLTRTRSPDDPQV